MPTIADHTEVWPIDRLIHYANNPRKNDHAVDPLAGAIKEFGFRVPIIAKSDGTIVDGHLRVKSAIKLGMTEVPVILADDLTDAQIKAFRIAVNRMSDLPEWDYDLLAVEFEQLDEMGFDTELTGFDVDEIKDICDTGPSEGLTDPDEVPELPEEPVTNLGDMYQLGDHRLICGDSTDHTVIEKLLGSNTVDIVFTSPPYNLGKSAKLRGNTHLDDNIYGEYDDNNPEYLDLLRKFVIEWRQVSTAQFINVQLLAGCKVPLVEWIHENKEYLCDVITWDKQHAAPAVAQRVLNSVFEWILIFAGKKANRSIPFASWRGTISNVYTAPPQRNNEYSHVHGATFPIHLPTFIINEVADTCKSVADPFMGTGTTMIACEQLGRTCYGVELDPIYCDVIVKRWEDFTGKKAVLLDD
jgi:DNA modification methylase